MMITYGTVKCQTDGCENKLQYFGKHLFGGNITPDGVYCFKCLEIQKNGSYNSLEIHENDKEFVNKKWCGCGDELRSDEDIKTKTCWICRSVGRKCP